MRAKALVPWMSLDQAAPAREARDALNRSPAMNERSMDKEKPKRRAPIPWRPPADRWDDFDARVARSGLSRNAFITDCVFGRNRYRPAEIKQLLQILGLEQQQADVLKGFEAEMAGDHQIKALLAALREGQIEIRSALFLLMGRRP